MAFPTRLEELMEEGRIAIRGMVRIDMPGQPYGFWNGNFTLPWAGLDYIPNQLMRVEEPEFAIGMDAADFKLEMPEASDFGITPDVLDEIESLPYKGALTTVYECYLDPDSGALLHVEPLAYGYIDTVDHVRGSGESKLVANVMSGAVDNHRESSVAASNEHQQLVSPGDRFFEYAGTVKHEVKTVKFD